MLEFKVACSSCDKFEWFNAVEWDGYFYCECDEDSYSVVNYEGNLSGMDLEELAEELAGADSDAERAQFLRYVDYFGDGSTLDRMRETCIGWFASAAEFAAQTLQDEACSLPSWVQNNVNWEGVAHDMRHELAFVENDHGVEVYTY